MTQFFEQDADIPSSEKKNLPPYLKTQLHWKSGKTREGGARSVLGIVGAIRVWVLLHVLLH
jgi:hypothetical protein